MTVRHRFKIVKPLETDAATYKLRCISTEAMSFFQPNVAIVAKLASTYEGLVVTLKSQISKVAGLPASFKKSRVESQLQRLPYTEVMDLRLPCINGQVCSWSEALDLLEQHEHVIAELPERVFAPFMKFAGTALNDPTKLNSANFRSTLRATDMSGLRKQYGALFGGTMDQSTFGHLCHRNTDWGIAHTRLTSLIEHSKIPTPSAVSKEVAEINDVLTKLFVAIQDPQKDYRPTGTVINEFSKLIQALAEEVTLYSLYMNYINQAVKAFKDGEDIILKNT